MVASLLEIKVALMKNSVKDVLWRVVFNVYVKVIPRQIQIVPVLSHDRTPLHFCPGHLMKEKTVTHLSTAVSVI